MLYLQKVKDALDEFRDVPLGRFVPCTPQEIPRLEQWLHLTLPEAYHEFLLWAGHRAGKLLAGSDCFYYHLTLIQKEAAELLQENHFPKSLPDDAFVFLMHQGYFFDFLRLSEGDDPRVYYYNECDHQEDFTVVAAHYSDFLSRIMMVDARILRDLRPRL